MLEILQVIHKFCTIVIKTKAFFTLVKLQVMFASLFFKLIKFEHS